MPDELSNSGRRVWNRIYLAFGVGRAVRETFDFKKLAIAALGLALLQAGWSLLDRLVPSSIGITPSLFNLPFSAMTPPPAGFGPADYLRHALFRLSEPARVLIAPLSAIVEPGGGGIQIVHSFARLLWLFVLWGFCGGAIARIAIIRFATMRTTRLIDAVRFAWHSARPLVLASLCPVIGLAFCACLAAAFGLLYWIPTAGPIAAGATLFVPLALGLLMTLMVAGLVLGWPLLHAAIAGGADDSLDALSRIFGYVNQRLGPFALLITLAGILGVPGLALVDFFAWGVVRLTHWSLGLVAPAAVDAAFALSPTTATGVTHSFWLALVHMFAHAWVYAYFWTVAAYLYLWLRHDVDGQSMTDFDEATRVPPAPIAPPE